MHMSWSLAVIVRRQMCRLDNWNVTVLKSIESWQLWLWGCNLCMMFLTTVILLWNVVIIVSVFACVCVHWQTLSYKTVLRHITPVSRWTHSYILSNRKHSIRMLAAQLQLPIKYVHFVFFCFHLHSLLGYEWMSWHFHLIYSLTLHCC